MSESEAKNYDIAIAKRLIELRLRSNLSLDELAIHTEISRATLSRFERAQTSPSAANLGRICSYYGITMSKLLLDIENEKTTIFHAKDAIIWQDPESKFTRTIIAPPANNFNVEIIKGEMPPSANIIYDKAPKKPVEQYLYILEGELIFKIDDIEYHLKIGDCLRARFHTKTEFINPLEIANKYLVIISHD